MNEEALIECSRIMRVPYRGNGYLPNLPWSELLTRVGPLPDAPEPSVTAAVNRSTPMKLVTGNTYPVKDQLKALGGRWDPDQKGWKVPDDKYDEAVNIVAAAPRELTGRAPRRSGRSAFFEANKCPNCGRKPDGGWGSPGYMCGEPCGD